jgi:Peptidase propeptide and YPEB domain
VRRRTMWIAGGVVTAVVVAGAGTGIAIAAGGDDENTPAITGPALERASAAALEHTGGGRVTETEAGDEEGAYEVEVTLDDGRQVDVHLDERFRVTSSEGDREGDEGGQDDD